MIVALERVSRRYGECAVLTDFDFALDDGAQALLHGPSGSGKTTLIYLICGLLRDGSRRRPGPILAPAGAP